MTVQQLLDALSAIAEKYRSARVWQCVIEGRIETTEMRVFKAGALVAGEGPVVVLFPVLMGDEYPPADLVIVPGDVV